MFQFHPRIYLDFASFWIGVVAASLAWFLYLRLKPHSAKIRKWIKSQIQSFRDKVAARTSLHLRQKTLEFAQGQHLSASFCSLDEILIPPRILASPHQLAPDGYPPDLNTLQETLPYTPDYPEFAADYRYPTLSLGETLKGGANIALVGRPGSGKTVALAHLASQLARNNIDHLGGWKPIFINANDVVPQLPSEQFITVITNALKSNPFYRQAGPLDEIVQDIFNEERSFIILDSLDQLPRREIVLVTNFIKSLQQKYPWIRLVTSASITYIDGLLESGLVPVALATWGTRKRLTFAQKWYESYQKFGHPEKRLDSSRMTIHKADDLLINSWLYSSNSNPTPLEFTLQIWGMYAGDSPGTSTPYAIEGYLRRMTPSLSNPTSPKLQRIAYSALVNQSYPFTMEDVQRWLNADPQDTTLPDSSNSLGDLLPACHESGILKISDGRRYRFSHPTIAGYLAGKALAKHPFDEVAGFIRNPQWPLAFETYRFSGSTLDPSAVTSQTMSGSFTDDLLAGDLIQQSLLLAHLPPQSEVRDNIRKKITKGILDTPLLESKLRLATILACSGDPEAESIFRYLLNQKQVAVRQIAIFGCGFMRSSKSVEEMIEQIGRDVYTDIAACFALVNIGTMEAMEVVTQLLLTGDEKVRRAAAEALANHPREGHPTLKDASELDKLTVRHAAVFGLQRVNEIWSQNILDEMRIEDEEWLVRNAAQQAYESLQGQSPFVPSKKISKEDLPWIETFMEHREDEVDAKNVSYKTILSVLTEGTPEQKMDALYTIRNEGFGSVFPELYHNLLKDTYPVRRAAADTLWYLSLSGLDIPSPQAFNIDP